MYLKHLEWFQYLRSSDSYAEFDIKYHPSLNLSMCTGLRRDTGADVVVKVFDRDDGTAIGPGDRDVLARCCPGLRGCHVPSQPNSHFPQRGHKPGRCWDGGGAWGRHALPLILRRLSSACCAAVAVRCGAGGASAACAERLQSVCMFTHATLSDLSSLAHAGLLQPVSQEHVHKSIEAKVCSSMGGTRLLMVSSASSRWRQTMRMRIAQEVYSVPTRWKLVEQTGPYAAPEGLHGDRSVR